MTLAEQLATLLEQGGDKPRHRVVAAEELRRLRAEVDQLRAELTALREQKPVALVVPQAVAQPLTEEQIAVAFGWKQGFGPLYSEVIATRIVERAHSIGQPANKPGVTK